MHKILTENLAPVRATLVTAAEDLYAHMDDAAARLVAQIDRDGSESPLADEMFVHAWRETRAALRTRTPQCAMGTGKTATVTAALGDALAGAMLARALVTRLGGLSEDSVFAASDDRDVFLFAENRGRVVLLANPMSEEAFARFARVLPHLTASPCRDATEVCEAVYAGHAKYAVLPIENAQDGALKRFTALIDRFALKKVFTCSVQDADHEQFTRFVLLSRTMETESAGRHGAERFFSCSIDMTDPSHLTDVLVAADFFGLHVTRADAVPLAHNSAGATFSLSFLRPERADLVGFFVYLSLEFAGFVPTGSYTQLK